MGRSVSPEDEGPKALLAAAQTVTGLVLEDSSDDDYFIKEETASPAADDRPFWTNLKFKPPTGPVRPPGTTAGKPPAPASQQQPTKTGRHGKASASKGAHKAPPSPGQPVIPRKIEDWDPWKGILHELYITQNRILRDIIGIMETKHNLRATPKMYKNQFARWGFFKYAVKRRPRTKAESSTEHSSSDDSLDGALVLSRDELLHAGDGSRSIQAGLTAVRRFLHGHVDRDPANLTIEEVAGFVDPCYRYFKIAMDLFNLSENVEGGRILRLAFFQIERKISKPTMKSFSDLCFLVPHLLLESGRRDILSAYLHYLSRLATVKYGKHPVAEIAASFASLVDDRPEDIMRYIMLLSQINSDIIAALPGVLDRNVEWARNQYLACQRTVAAYDPGGRSSSFSSSSSTSSTTTTTNPVVSPITTGTTAGTPGLHDHAMIRLEAQSVYWAQKLIMHDPGSDEMAAQWLRRQFAADFGPRCSAYLARVISLTARGEFPVVFARMMECLYVGWLYDYYETVGEWEEALKWGRRGLELSTDEQYAIWSVHLEDVLGRLGRGEEKEALRRRRREHAWLEKVRVEVDRLSIG